MEKITRIGMDTSKSFFQLHGVDAGEKVVLRKKLRRGQVLAFFAALAPTRIGMEACGGSHYWARELKKLGHEVVLMPPQYAKAYVKRNKNDPADAEALCEAMGRPNMRFVAVKTEKAQAGLMMMGVREQLVNRRTQIANSIRGFAAEFGHVVPKGLDKIEALLLAIEDDTALPESAREMFVGLAQDFAHVEIQIGKLEQKLATVRKENPDIRRLQAVPGIGPIGAMLIDLKLVDAKAFKSARHFAAWVGLTPRDHSTAGKQKLGAITRAGDEALRQALVQGAMAVIRQARRKLDRTDPWLKALMARKPAKLAAVALANKNARIAWKMMATGASYKPQRAPMSDTQRAA